MMATITEQCRQHQRRVGQREWQNDGRGLFELKASRSHFNERKGEMSRPRRRMAWQNREANNYQLCMMMDG
jgi:hypothetical protein